jgi:hypothetical protein
MGGMSAGGIKGLFDPLGIVFQKKDPPAPTVQAAPQAPGDSQESRAAQDAAAEAERRRRGAGGRASNILTGPLGDVSTSSTASAQLLGG